MYGLNTNLCCCSIIKTPPIFDIYIIANTGGIIYFFSALPSLMRGFWGFSLYLFIVKCFYV